ncbi:hypothetical protein LXL04_018615 [Taraxacum kok-saghyz]
MLHKSFKPAKCKTSLKLATSRIKLMRNKKGVQINQMKRDLAQLLETGQDRTARIRVEHVIREEKTIAAYDLIEIYCELIVARMPIIESQKTCPIDLKEAVTSVIFAAPRCSDISELADIKKQFTAKFGKEFVSAALELRPESGVSRMLVEKLSAVAPDIQTKVKVLTGVAKDHNINWEPTSFEEKESNPQNDLLASQSFQMGPTEHASVANANANPGLTKIQPSSINHEKNTGPPLDFAQQNKKYVVDHNAVGTSSSSVVSEKKEEGQNWNMGFKDATSAAEAAAESAERAAMAARAAAQFASHEKIPGRDEKASHIRDSYERKPKINYQQMDQSEHEQKDNNTRSNKSNTFKESKPELQSGKKESFSGNRNPKVINQEMDRYEHEQKDTERFHEAKSKSSKLNSFVESKTELESGTKGSFESENVNFFAEEASRKQARDHDSSSGYEFNDEVVSDDKKVGKRSVVGNPFAVVDERNIFSESRKSKSDVVDQIDDEATFDDDDDVDGGPKFDTGFEYDEFGESSIHSLENAHIWSPRRNESIKIEKTSSSQSHLFSENLSFGKHSVKSSETEDRVPASFDHSDSDNESEFTGNNNNFNDIPEPLIRKSQIELNDLVEEERESSYHDRENEEKKKRESEEKSYDRFEDNNESLSPSNEVELNFGKLTGGLRHKAVVLKYPPYTKPATKTDAVDLPNKSITESSIIVNEIIPDSKASKKTSVSKSNRESDSDDYSDKFPVPSSNPRSQFSPPTPFFDNDEENDVMKQTSSSVRLRSELSRRTRGSPSISRSKIHVNPNPNPKPATSSSINNRYSYSDEITADPPSIVRKTEGSKKTTEAKIQMPVRKSEESGKTMENLGSVDNLVKKPSYVHPKLPDYDTFAARLQSLRDERK